MTIKFGMLMDPIARIKPVKDSSLAMLLAAQRRGWQLFYFEIGDLFALDGIARASVRALQVRDQDEDWFTFGPRQTLPLTDMDIVVMRKDPPVDTRYLHATRILELAETAGALVVNRPAALRDANEKLATAWFPQCCPPSIFSSQPEELRDFLDEHRDIILKPLDHMGGASIYRLTVDDPNISVLLEDMTRHGGQLITAQRYLPAIADGDKRILLVDGKPVDYALARIPATGETRGNLAAGGRAEGVPLSDRDRWICEQTGAALAARGLMFVGLDVIGDYLTEINVTSPTCIRELDTLYTLDIAGDLMDAIESHL